MSGLVGFVSVTYLAIKPFPSRFSELYDDQIKHHYYDRYGVALNSTYANEYNSVDRLSLHKVPSLFIKALLLSEDSNFYEHHGVDWIARFSALYQNIKEMKWVRGASTLSEQVVRIIHPRKRTLFSKWVEGFESSALEEHYSKSDILEFYINQVPFGAQRRGLKQAAHYYFGRDVETLNSKEILALVVLIRSPYWYNPFTHQSRLDKKVLNLALRLKKNNKISNTRLQQIRETPLVVGKEKPHINAQHFLQYVSKHLSTTADSSIYTTLDAYYQESIQKILDTKLEALKSRNVHNGAVLVIDHETNEVRSWVVGYAGKKDKKSNSYDPIQVLRQPGSTLKPFLYANALERGWEASTLIEDAPLREGVGIGSHTYHNYSNLYYGWISVREALANSLNIPAIKTIQFVGTENFLDFLKRFGVKSLDKHPSYYGDGIALGNSEVTLLELTQAYATLARMGSYKVLSVIENRYKIHSNTNVLDARIASLISDILSDPVARSKEFGWNSILNLSNQTAVKTGTSSDYRDAWVFGYDDKYTIGIWVGNLDYESMKKVTGSVGPAPILKTVFALLNKKRESRALYLSPYLNKKRSCIKSIDADECSYRDEYYLWETNATLGQKQIQDFHVIEPSKNLIMAKDPRIPDAVEVYVFKVSYMIRYEYFEWYLNDKLIATTKDPEFDWHIERGDFILKVKAFRKEEIAVSEAISFYVQ